MTGPSQSSSGHPSRPLHPSLARVPQSYPQGAGNPTKGQRIDSFELTDELLEPQSATAARIVLVRVAGEVDYSASPRLRQRLQGLISSGHRHLLVDLSQVTFIDSMGLGVLVGAVAQLRASGGGMLLAVSSSPSERVRRIFAVAGVEHVIPLYRSRDAALAALAADAAGEEPPGASQLASA